MSGEKIVSAMQNIGINAASGTVSELLYGTVVQVNPLKIKIDERETLPEQFFFLGQMVKGRITSGTRVAMLSFNGSQRYYVTEALVDDASLCFGIYQSDGGFIVDRIGYLPKKHFWIGQLLRSYNVTMPHTNPPGGGVAEPYVPLEIYDVLKPGDKCLLFSFNKGEMYYVAEKVGV